jgi:hypothetical protein
VQTAGCNPLNWAWRGPPYLRANRAEPSFVPGLGDARPVNRVKWPEPLSQCRAPAILRQAFGGVMPTPGRGSIRRDVWQAGDQATATSPPSPSRQIRLAFARGPVAATAITRKMASKFTPLLWHPDCSTRLRKQQVPKTEQLLTGPGRLPSSRAFCAGCATGKTAVRARYADLVSPRAANRQQIG